MRLSERLQRKSASMDIFATAGTIGLHMVTGPAVGFGLGYGAEALLASIGFDISPWGKLVGFFIGIGGGFLSVYEDSQRLLRKMDTPRSSAGHKPAPEGESGKTPEQAHAHEQDENTKR